MKLQATELHIGQPAEVRVAFDPYVSVLALITDALGRRRGAPQDWRQRIRATIRPDSARAVLPIVQPHYSITPDSVTPENPAREIPVADQLAHLHDLSDDDLASDLHGVFGDTPPPHWQDASRRPRRWLHAYACAMADAWTCVEPLWKQAQPLLAREVERVGIASVRGQLGVILAGLHPASRFADGVLRIRDPEPGSFRLGGRALVLVPMLSGPDALICNLDRDDAVWIGYPLPGTARLPAGASAAHRAGLLASLTGPVRAQLLRAAATPLTMGELASRMRLPPSAITYHCERLAAAGLIERERRGREVRVSLTPVGDTLLDLFSA
jgi:DNA-binding transcriptional ArsR family regulator